MKKLFALALVVLGLAACQTEPNELDVNVGGEVLTTVNISIPETTRSNSALGAFDNVDFNQYTIRYILQVFTADGQASKFRDVKYSDGDNVAFDVRLIPGRDYKFVCWADIVKAEGKNDGEYSADDDIHYNTSKLTEITLKGNWDAMDETRDAFTVSAPVTNYNGASVINIELKRPFAKLRVKTTDLTELGYFDVTPRTAKVTYSTSHRSTFNAFESKAESADVTSKVHEYTIATYDDNTAESMILFTDYFFAEDDVVKFDLEVFDANGESIRVNSFTTDIPVKRNYVTTIAGNILTDGNNVNVTIEDAFDGAYDYEDDDVTTTVNVNTAEELAAAFDDNSDVDVVVLTGDINLNDLFTRAAYTALTINNGKTLTIDLGGNKLTATTSENSGNQELFLVKGNLTVKNGTIEYEHVGENMGWGSMTTIFDVTAGGVLNLEGVTAKNLGGSDMGFVAHLNNWGEVTLNVDNCTLESNYVPVRVFNSGYDMNNVTIKNSTLKGVSAAFWVHNYTVADFGSEAKAESQKALLNFEIYNQGNTFSPDVNGLRYGFTNSIRTDAYGITKVVSEDGTEVTLGSIVENGLIRRGVAGDEENTTITKVVVEEGVGVLYDRTFRRFYALETVELPSTLTTIGAAGSGVFQSCTNLKNIVIPESVTVIGKGTFQECSSLESINIPAGVTRIEADALRATGLKSVEFHEGVTYFGAQAFRDCKQLKEVVINAPEFTVEANAFGVMAGTLPGTIIYVANAEMRAYLESTLAYKDQFTIVAPTEVNNSSAINEALSNGENVILTDDINVAKSEAGSNGYGATGISQTNGGTIDGNGNDISVNAWGTWDSAINTTGGTIKNLNVTGGMRGIFVNHNSTNCSKVILENVTIDGTIYTISCDQGTNNGLEAYNSTFNGWTSYAATIGAVKFDGCSFGEGQGYAFCRPYAATEFVNCNFAEGYEVDAVATITFENCTINGVALTDANLSTLVPYNTANASVK